DQFGKQLPYADGLEIFRITDDSTAQAAFRTRQIVMYGVLTGAKTVIDSLRKSNPEIKVLELFTPGPTAGPHLVVRADRAPTNDLRVRQGATKFIDRQSVIDTIFLGKAQYTGFLSVTDKDQSLPEDEAKRLMARDVSDAKQLLQQAGFTGWNTTMWNSL